MSATTQNASSKELLSRTASELEHAKKALEKVERLLTKKDLVLASHLKVAENHLAFATKKLAQKMADDKGIKERLHHCSIESDRKTYNIKTAMQQYDTLIGNVDGHRRKLEEQGTVLRAIKQAILGAQDVSRMSKYTSKLIFGGELSDKVSGQLSKEVYGDKLSKAELIDVEKSTRHLEHKDAKKLLEEKELLMKALKQDISSLSHTEQEKLVDIVINNPETYEVIIFLDGYIKGMELENKSLKEADAEFDRFSSALEAGLKKSKLSTDTFLEVKAAEQLPRQIHEMKNKIQDPEKVKAKIALEQKIKLLELQRALYKVFTGAIHFQDAKKTGPLSFFKKSPEVWLDKISKRIEILMSRILSILKEHGIFIGKNINEFLNAKLSRESHDRICALFEMHHEYTADMTGHDLVRLILAPYIAQIDEGSREALAHTLNEVTKPESSSKPNLDARKKELHALVEKYHIQELLEPNQQMATAQQKVKS